MPYKTKLLGKNNGLRRFRKNNYKMSTNSNLRIFREEAVES